MQLVIQTIARGKNINGMIVHDWACEVDGIGMWHGSVIMFHNRMATAETIIRQIHEGECLTGEDSAFNYPLSGSPS